jgi:hypothetical protein
MTHFIAKNDFSRKLGEGKSGSVVQIGSIP